MRHNIIRFGLFALIFFPTAIATGTFLPNLIVTLIALSIIFFYQQKEYNFKIIFLK